MRIVLGVVAGLIVAFLCVYAVEAVGHLVYPPPPGIDFNDPAAAARMMSEMSGGALAMVAAAWFVGAFAGAWAANAIARQTLAGWIVALLVFIGAVVTMAMIPHPAWMWAAVILPLAAGWLAQRLAGSAGDRNRA